MWRNDSSFSNLRLPALEFLIESAPLLEVTPVVKYTALSLFAHRFCASLSRFVERLKTENWLLQPMRESNLQLFALISIWISSKIHDSRPLSVQRLKTLANKSIKEQHFTARDFLDAVLNYEIGAGNISFTFLEDLLAQFRGVAKVGELVDVEACMDIMDLLYEKEETTNLYSSPHALAASTLVASYVISVPKQRWEFPIIAWVHQNPSSDIGMRDFLPPAIEEIDRRWELICKEQQDSDQRWELLREEQQNSLEQLRRSLSYLAQVIL
ncbi:cyclin-J18 isoform X2 [Euphorbia lathyris]|uniref:cyclin-J18 isoform X2 n=1 Tax=Euphorbia lathyris TaxID=212925 RepID=UPI003313E69D